MGRCARAVLLCGITSVGGLLFVDAVDAAPAPAHPPLTFSDGSTIDLANSPTELLFVARWCTPCEKEISAARRRRAELKRLGVTLVLIGVDQRQDAAQFESWARGAGWEGPVSFDADRRLETGFEVKLLPWHTVIGKQGKVVYGSDAAPSSDAYKQWVGE